MTESKSINFTELLQRAAIAGNDLIPIADYSVEITKAEATTSSTGKDMIKASLRIFEGPYTNKVIEHYFVMSTDNDEQLSRFFRDLRTFGLSNEIIVSHSSLVPIAQALVGRRAVTRTKHDSFGGGRNKCSYFNPYTGPQPGSGVAVPSPYAGPVPPTAAPGPVPQPVPPTAPLAGTSSQQPAAHAASSGLDEFLPQQPPAQQVTPQSVPGTPAATPQQVPAPPELPPL